MKNQLITRILQGGGLSVVKLVSGIIKIKVIAFLLGVSGVGLLSLALQFQATAIAVVSMSLAVGVINLGRPILATHDIRDTAAISGTALGLVGMNALIFSAIFALSNESIQKLVIDSQVDIDNLTIWPIILAAIVYSIATAYGESTTFLIDRFDLYIKANIITSIIDALLFIGGAHWFGLQGAIFASLGSSIVLLMSYFFLGILSNQQARELLRNINFKKKWIRPLLSFSALMLFTATFGNLALLMARTKIVAVSGVNANGLLQVVTALSAYLSPFIMNGVWGHLHPYVAKLGDCTEARVALRETLGQCARLAACGCSSVILLAPFLIPFIYTKDFLDAIPYLGYYFIGETFFLLLSVYGAYLLATGNKRIYLIGNIGYYFLVFIGTFLSVDVFGVYGYIMSHIISSIVFFILALHYAVKKDQLTPLIVKQLYLWIGFAIAIIFFNMFSNNEVFKDYSLWIQCISLLLICFAMGRFFITNFFKIKQTIA